MPDRRPASQPVVGPHAPKLCATCGRTIEYRKKFARAWDDVKYCSTACRTHKPGSQDAALEEAILTLLAARERDKTVCPSEAARSVAPEAWELLMQPARAAARRLVAAGKIVITQHGAIVDGSTAKGPIRLRLK